MLKRLAPERRYVENDHTNDYQYGQYDVQSLDQFLVFFVEHDDILAYMAENEERTKFWHIFYSPLVLIILLVIFVLMVRAILGIYGHEQVSEQDRKRVEGELATTNQRAAVLKDQVGVLQTPQGVDDAIRSKFNVTKTGEGVAVVLKVTNSTSTTATPVLEKGWWQKFTDFWGL